MKPICSVERQNEIRKQTYYLYIPKGGLSTLTALSTLSSPIPNAVNALNVGGWGIDE